MRRLRLALLPVVLGPLAACQQGDPQRERAYEEMTGHAPNETAPEDETVGLGSGADLGANAPGYSESAEQRRGMPVPDTTKSGEPGTFPSTNPTHTDDAAGTADPSEDVAPPAGEGH